MTGIATSAEAVEALKPCPFCGAEAKLWPPTYSEENPSEVIGPAFVNCPDCCVAIIGTWEDDAVAAWNRRSALIPPSRAGEAVAWRGIVDGRTAERDQQREHIRKQAEDIMTLGKLVYATENETWQDRATDLRRKLEEARKALANCASIVRVQNGNLHPDVNAILASAEAVMSGWVDPDDCELAGN